MSNPEKDVSVPLIPMEEVDLLIGCGEVLIADHLVHLPGQPPHPPILLAVLMDEGPAFTRYALPAGLRVEDYSEAENCLETLQERALAILDQFRAERSPLLGPGAIPPEPPVLLSLVACLAAKFLLQGEGCRFGEIQPLFGLYGASTLSDLKRIANAIQSLCKGPEALLVWSWRSKRDPYLFHSSLSLTPRAMGLLQFPKLEAQTPRSGPRRAPWDEEPPQAPRTVLTEPTSLPTFADLALPPALEAELAFVASLLKQEPQAAPVLLFHGPPGTGKTYTAKALAGETGRRLASVSIPSILHKWVGESEQNLAAAFEEAASASAILLVDEADALLQDRGRAYLGWQTMLVNTFLKLLEETLVPVILCTNLLSSMDLALMRRVQHLLEFPLPGLEERLRIWTLELTQQGLRLGFDLEALARVPLTGGLIHNVALQAARRSRVLGKAFQPTTALLLDLTRNEAKKLGVDSARRLVGFGGYERPASGPEDSISVITSVRCPEKMNRPIPTSGGQP